MSPLQFFPVTEKHIPTSIESPVLTIFIPTFNRSEELSLCVHSIAHQVVGDLSGKVEIIISDNASPSDIQAGIRTLSDCYECVGYYLNLNNGGAETQVLCAPWRARGRWLWVFGDDDLLAENGLGQIVDLLTSRQPDFVTVNRCVVNMDLSQVIIPRKHAIKTLETSNLIELTRAIGVDQFSFLTSQIYDTHTAKSIDTENYHFSGGAFNQVAYYIEGFHDRPSIYFEEALVIHRWDDSATDKHSYNFHQLAVSLPRAIAGARDRLGLPDDLMENLGGVKFAGIEPNNSDTFVDNLINYLWMAISHRQPVTDEDWAFLEAESRHWSPERDGILAEARKLHDDL
eukprot:gene11967-13558_t